MDDLPNILSSASCSLQIIQLLSWMQEEWSADLDNADLYNAVQGMQTQVTWFSHSVITSFLQKILASPFLLNNAYYALGTILSMFYALYHLVLATIPFFSHCTDEDMEAKCCTVLWVIELGYECKSQNIHWIELNLNCGKRDWIRHQEEIPNMNKCVKEPFNWVQLKEVVGRWFPRIFVTIKTSKNSFYKIPIFCDLVVLLSWGRELVKLDGCLKSPFIHLMQSPVCVESGNLMTF